MCCFTLVLSSSTLKGWLRKAPEDLDQFSDNLGGGGFVIVSN